MWPKRWKLRRQWQPTGRGQQWQPPGRDASLVHRPSPRGRANASLGVYRPATQSPPPAAAVTDGRGPVAHSTSLLAPPDWREARGTGTNGGTSAPLGCIDARWAPIEIGEPILSFEPRPAPLDGMYYPADTVCDGWSTPDVTVRLASVRGYAHRYKGTPRQDDAVVAIHATTGAVVFAVADGVSNSRLSHIGASIACRSAVLSVLADLDNAHLVDWSGALRDVASRMTGYVADLYRQPVDTDTVGRLLATTLVLGIARPGADGVTATLVQIGDTSAWLLSGGSYQPILVEKTAAAAAVVSSAVYALPSVPERVRPVHVEIPPDGVLLVGTDGFGDPLGDGVGDVGAAFAHALAAPPPPLGLAHLLDFSRETFDDDRTLLAIWVGGR